ncbi:hypothetical protein BDZ45DRAFT_734753 [Acephala macrosclerotiorum]|nr:hypothetical protein BDZ45DRAFT_734753 [Acephala macrosclerotiorum]
MTIAKVRHCYEQPRSRQGVIDEVLVSTKNLEEDPNPSTCDEKGESGETEVDLANRHDYSIHGPALDFQPQTRETIFPAHKFQAQGRINFRTQAESMIGGFEDDALQLSNDFFSSCFHDTQRFYTGPEKLQTLSLLSVSCSPVAPSSSALFSSTSQYRGTIYVLSALLHSKPHRRTSTHLENSAADSDHAGPYRISVLHPTSLCIGLSKTCVIICRSLSGIQERILVPATQSSTEVPQSNTLGRSHPTSLVANGALSWEVGDQND